MIGPANSFGDLLQLLVKEGKKRLLGVTAMFSVVAVAGLGIGLALPKKWDAAATLLVEESNIIKPLMEGRAVTTNASDQTAVVTQVVLSRRVMREILYFGNWLSPPPAPQPDPREEENMLNKLRQHIRIDALRDGLIRIGFSDSDQKRVARIANHLAEVYVRESNEAQERESREAFDFIDRQVKEYGEKLTAAHQSVLAYYHQEEAPTALPTQAGDPAKPKSKAQLDELAALRAEEATLSAQLGKSASKGRSSADAKQAEDRARAHVLDLQAQLDRMSVSYTDEHPDVRRLKRELAAAQSELDRAVQATFERQQATDAASALDDEVSSAARARLDAVRTRIGALTGKPVRHRSASAVAAAQEEKDPEMKGVGHDTKLSELLRQYESTRDVYQDLLKRRETARVSMVLDAERRGLTLRIQEAAEQPVIPSSLRLMHLSIIALVFAMLVPIGFLLGIIALDRRVRSALQIEQLAKVPLLVSINYAPAKREISRERKRGVLVVVMVAGVLAVYAAAFVIKLKTT